MGRSRTRAPRDTAQLPVLPCPWCDTPMGIWEGRFEDGRWRAICAGCGAMAMLFAPLGPNTRVYLA